MVTERARASGLFAANVGAATSRASKKVRMGKPHGNAPTNRHLAPRAVFAILRFDPATEPALAPVAPPRRGHGRNPRSRQPALRDVDRGGIRPSDPVREGAALLHAASGPRGCLRTRP